MTNRFISQMITTFCVSCTGLFIATKGLFFPLIRCVMFVTSGCGMRSSSCQDWQTFNGSTTPASGPRLPRILAGIFLELRDGDKNV